MYPVDMLKYILLGFLNYRPMTGYTLKSILDQSTMHFWHAYHSQIYTTLRKLEDEGLVESEEEMGEDKLNRRLYQITPAGAAELERWLAVPLDDLPPIKDALLVRLFFSGSRDKQAVIDELKFQLQLHRRKLETYGWLQSQPLHEIVSDEEAAVSRDVPFWRATLRFGIEFEKAYVTWLQETIEMVEALK